MKPMHSFVLLASSLLVLAASSDAALARDREVSASGSCTRFSAPDRGQVVLTTEVRHADLQTAARRATEIYERAVSGVKKLGLEHAEYRTVEYTLAEVREWEKERMVSKGFQARIGLQVSTSSIQKLGDVIALGAREGLKDVGGLSTFLSEEKLRKERSACMQEAAEDAQAQARKLAEALGARLGEAVQISESHPEGGPARPMMTLAPSESMRSAKAMPAPPIEGGQQEISVRVQATFALH